MKIALAQVASIRGDIRANAAKHADWATQVAGAGASLVLFPELSLSGFWPKLAEELAIDPGDPRLDVLQGASDQTGCRIAAGVPSRTSTGQRISMVLFGPGEPRQLYSKQLLHEDELPYFECGTSALSIDLQGLCVAPAICYEALQPQHSDAAAAAGAHVYLASVAKPQRGVERAYSILSEVARRHSMPVAMANNVGESEDFQPAGRSAVWGADGQILGELDGTQEAALLWSVESGAVETLDLVSSH